MKAASESSKTRNDFYGTTLATVSHSREARFVAADAVMLVVLILEIAVLTRLLLAN